MGKFHWKGLERRKRKKGLIRGMIIGVGCGGVSGAIVPLYISESTPSEIKEVIDKILWVGLGFLIGTVVMNVLWERKKGKERILTTLREIGVG